MAVLKYLSFAIVCFVCCCSGCRVPPQFWCDTKEIATECQVYDQCKQHVWPSAFSPVSLTLYYESLCPDCKEFFQNQLTPTYHKVSEIMTLTLVPYGNAREKQVGDKWQFECQHGVHECEGNIIETCALSLLKNMTAAFPFISCMEASDKLPTDSAVDCAAKYGINLAPIKHCTQSLAGNKLEHQMAEQTEKLNPPHTYVPWVTLNGIHTDKIQHAAESNLLALICDTYQGLKPVGCSTYHTHSSFNPKYQRLHSNNIL